MGFHHRVRLHRLSDQAIETFQRRWTRCGRYPSRYPNSFFDHMILTLVLVGAAGFEPATWSTQNFQNGWTGADGRGPVYCKSFITRRYQESIRTLADARGQLASSHSLPSL